MFAIEEKIKGKWKNVDSFSSERRATTAFRKIVNAGSANDIRLVVNGEWSELYVGINPEKCNPALTLDALAATMELERNFETK